MSNNPFLVTPANAGAPFVWRRREGSGVPDFAGMTMFFDGMN